MKRARYLALVIGAAAALGCSSSSGSGNSSWMSAQGDPPGPEWLVGEWRTTHDMTTSSDRLHLRADGVVQFDGESAGTWSSDGQTLVINDSSFQMAVSEGCHFITLDEIPYDYFRQSKFVKLDNSGCPTAPELLSAAELGLVGKWRVLSSKDYYVTGMFTLRADRTAKIGYSKSKSGSLSTFEWDAEGVWSYDDAEHMLWLRIPSHKPSAGSHFLVSLDEDDGHPDWLCIGTVCVDVYHG
jgi:hypothetical protein